MKRNIETLCDDFSIKLKEEDKVHPIVYLWEFDVKFDKYEIINDVKNQKDRRYVFLNNEYCLIFFPYNTERMVIFKKIQPPFTLKQFDANAFEVVLIESLLREASLHLNLSPKINGMFIHDHNYLFDQKLINNGGYESYIFKSENDTHEYMLTITPDDKEKTLIEYIRPKGENRRAFEEITKSDGSLYSIT